MSSPPPQTPSPHELELRNLPPTFRDFFPLHDAAETDADIRRDIALLSALLKDHRPGKSTVKQGRSRSIIATVARNTSPKFTPVRRQNPVEVDRVAVHPHENVKEMLQNSLTLHDDVKFEDHLRDVMSILSYLLTYPGSNRNHLKSPIISYVFDFIVMRCYRKLYMRLRSGITLWTKHPLERLHDFYQLKAVGQASSTANTHESVAPELPPTAMDQASPQGIAQESHSTGGQDSPLSVNLPRAYMYRDLLQDHNIQHTETKSEDMYSFHAEFSSAAAPAWAKLLFTCYTTILHTLSQKPTQMAVHGGRRPTSMLELRDLQAILALLDDAVRGGIVERLFQDELVGQLNTQYMKSMKEKTKPELATRNNGVSAEDGLEYDVDDLKVGDEDSRHHILRHLQALTIPLRAAVKIVNSCFNAPPAISLKAYQVIVTPDTDVILGKHFDRFVAKFAKRCDADLEIVNQVLADLRSVTLNVTPSVHAEAVLMSLATAAEVQVDGMPAPGASLLPPDPTPVAVSKRCCFCCSQLAELMKPGSGVGAKTGFVLSGTHGTVFPWLPPVDVSSEVLKAMREKLLRALYNTFDDPSVRPHSAQTSPAKSDIDIEIEEEMLGLAEQMWSDRRNLVLPDLL
ncbi:hypothetical protein C8Q74DRAFT_1219693 [Fomes fomentarius]|nr:hypothetical protein C8Q74DRAFT_1219693 [Fomes fomentarius]